MQKTICKILTAILICVMVLGIPVAAAQQTAAEEPKSRVDAWNLVLAGDIAVNFLVEISDEVSADAVMEITDGYGITAYPINTLEPDANGRYLFTARLAAAQMADSIYLRLIDGGQVVSTHTYRATQYAQAVLGGN